MTNALDYIAWRGDLSFETSPINEVDIFLFSQLVGPDYTGIIGSEPISIADTAARYFALHNSDTEKLGLLQASGIYDTLRGMAGCIRFKDVMLSDYVRIYNQDNVEQFSAFTATLSSGTMVIAYRGTDDTLIGWKEDFNLALLDEVPAQADACEYLNRMSAGFCGDIILCGHSKGGNLAVYAAANAPAPVRVQLRSVYNFDGPGFKYSFIESKGYAAVKDIIISILPQYSVVGLLLNGVGVLRIVKCRTKGPMAHDGFNWEVTGPAFVSVPELSSTSVAFNIAADDTVLNMPPEELKAFIDEFFDILLSTGANTITEFNALKPGVKLDTLRKLLTAKHTTGFRNEFIEKLVKTLIHD